VHYYLRWRELVLRVPCDEAITTMGASVDGLEVFEGKAARSVIFLRNELQSFHYFSVLSFADEELGSLFEADESQTCDAHGQNKSTISEPDITPAPVVVPVAWYTSSWCRGIANRVAGA
jgi:hypothetical protein